jgi:LmeA-like phospholipid-binding
MSELLSSFDRTLMEFFTILLSALMGLVSPAGFVVEEVAADAIRDQVDSVETLQVRVDNTPSHQLLQGRVDRLRIAARGLFPLPEIRVDTLEVETEAIAIDPRSLQTGKPQLQQPLQAGVRLVLRKDDFNRALRSPDVAAQLRQLSIGLINSEQAQQLEVFEFVDPQVEFLEGDRLRLRVLLQNAEAQYEVIAESGLEVPNSSQIRVINPRITINNQPVPPVILQLLTEGLNRRLDLHQLEDNGITARILQFDITDEEIAIATFIRVQAGIRD